MYDPMTVAHEIRSLIPRRGFGKTPYYRPIVTIWHRDPERRTAHGNRDDDSCGWFLPPTTHQERLRISTLGVEMFSTIFEKIWAASKGKSYVGVCYEPSTYDAVYWAWRRIKYHQRKGWQFGPRHDSLSRKELEEIYCLASNPVDNLRVIVAGIKDAESCGDFFLCVYRIYKRFHRPWYRHPRWHFWHWSVQFHPWQTLRRWLFSRCARCGKRFAWGYSPISHSWDSTKPKPFRGEVGVYHSECVNVAPDLHRAPIAGSA